MWQLIFNNDLLTHVSKLQFNKSTFSLEAEVLLANYDLISLWKSVRAHVILQKSPNKKGTILMRFKDFLCMIFVQMT